MDVLAKAIASYLTVHSAGVCAGGVVASLYIMQRILRRNHKNKNERTISCNAHDRMRLQRLDASSRGLTVAVNDTIKLQWIRDIFFWNSNNNDLCNNDALIEYLGGVLWFRFHVGADFTAPQSSLPVVMRCPELLEWAFGPLLSKSNELFAAVMESMEAIMSLKMDAFPERVLLILLDEVLEAHGGQQHLSRIRGYLGFLNVLEFLETSGMVRVVFILPSRSRRGPLNEHLFIDRLEKEAGTNTLVLASLPRILTNLRFYSKAVTLLQDSATADAYLSSSSKNHTCTLFAVQSWIDDARHLTESMEFALVGPPSDFLKISLTCMSKSLLMKQCAIDNEDDDVILDLAAAYFTIGVHLSELNARKEALVWLEQASHFLQRLFTRCCFGIANGLWYLGIVCGTRRDDKVGLQCLSFSKDLQKNPCARTLLRVLLEVVQPCLLIMDDRVDSADTRRGGKPDFDKGMEFTIDQLQRQIRQIVNPAGNLANTLNAIAIRVDDPEAELARQLSEIRRLAEKLSSRSIKATI